MSGPELLFLGIWPVLHRVYMNQDTKQTRPEGTVLRVLGACFSSEGFENENIESIWNSVA